MIEPIEVAVASVVYREDLYPRIQTSATAVQKYAEDLDVLRRPPSQGPAPRTDDSRR